MIRQARYQSRDQARDEGTVLLSTLLVLALMSAVALALMTTVRRSVDRTVTAGTLAQADLYLSGAEDFARTVVDGLAGRGNLGAELATAEPVVLPVEGGVMSLRVRAGSHCLRLSALTNSAGVGSETERRQFEGLMSALGVDPARAARIAAAAVDWVDRDQQARPGGAEDPTYLSRIPPHRTADVPMQSITELRAVAEMDETLFQRLRPFLCLGAPGAPTRFDIDSAGMGDIPVLAAILGGGAESLGLAEQLLRDRPSGGFQQADRLRAAPVLQNTELPGANFDAIVFSTDRVVVEVDIRLGEERRAQLFGFEGVDSGAVRLTYRSWDRAEFRRGDFSSDPVQEGGEE